MEIHGTTYRYKKGCRCSYCREAKAKEYAKSYRPKQRTNGRTPAELKYPKETWDFAKRLLEDGASYREVAYTTGIPRTTLQDKLPGMGWTYAEGRDIYKFNKKNLTAYDEFVYDPGRRKT